MRHVIVSWLQKIQGRPARAQACPLAPRSSNGPCNHVVSRVTASRKVLTDIISSPSALYGLPNKHASSQTAIRFGLDTFRHQPIIPDYMKGATPAEQYRGTTSKLFVAASKLAAKAGLGLSPLQIEQITQGLTGGGITQFAPGRAQVGRSTATTMPVAKRFVRSSAIEGQDTQESITQAQQMQANDSVRRRREALDLLARWKTEGVSKEARSKQIAGLRRTDKALADKVADLVKEQDLGITYADKQMLALGVESGARALAITLQLGKLKDQAERDALLKSLQKKGILTDKVRSQLKRLQRAS